MLDAEAQVGTDPRGLSSSTGQGTGGRGDPPLPAGFL